MTTQELVERMRVHIHKQIMHPDVRGDLRAAASRLSEMDAEIKRLREALNETIIDLNVYSDIGIIRARTIERRAALEHDKGEPKP